MSKRGWFYVCLGILILDALLIFWWYAGWRDRRHDRPILAAARRYGVEPALVKAVVWRESRFESRARGRSGEIGLMQIMPSTGQQWATEEKVRGFHRNLLFDPEINTRVGAWYLGKALRRYQHTDNPAAYALADYNAGRSNVLRWNSGAAATNSTAFLRQMDYPGTRDYIQSVLQRLNHYRSSFH